MRSPLIHIGGSLFQTAWELSRSNRSVSLTFGRSGGSPFLNRCVILHVLNHGGSPVRIAVWALPSEQVDWRYQDRPSLGRSGPSRPYGFLNPRFGSTVTLRLSVLRRLPHSVAGGGSLWTSAARLPSGPRAPCPIRDIWGPLLLDFIGLHGADVRQGVLQPRTQTSSPEILPQEFFQKVTAAAVQWRDAP